MSWGQGSVQATPVPPHPASQTMSFWRWLFVQGGRVMLEQEAALPKTMLWDGSAQLSILFCAVAMTVPFTHLEPWFSTCGC